jgi:hypothetical protein
VLGIKGFDRCKPYFTGNCVQSIFVLGGNKVKFKRQQDVFETT